MIRRESSAPQAAGAEWILISQVDHARLSGRLAERWGGGGVAPLVERDELLWAIAHHDDGWSEWEKSPDVKPELARPRSFIEMELADSLEIWAISITGAAEFGPLAGYVVAGHFCALLRRYDEGWKNDKTLSAEADRFLATYESLMDGCLKAWHGRRPADNTPERAALALAQLQFFDALSLWFCCQEATEADELPTPSGPTITLLPLARQAGAGPLRVAMTPWPMTVDSSNLEIQGRAVPARRYESSEDLAAVPEKPVEIRWHLQPAKS